MNSNAVKPKPSSWPPVDTDLISDSEALSGFEEFRSGYEPGAGLSPENTHAGWRQLAETVSLLDVSRTLPPELQPYEDSARAYLSLAERLKLLDSAEGQAALRSSLAGRIGIALEVISKPLGF